MSPESCVQNGLRARPRRPFRPKTTQPDHSAHPSPVPDERARAAIVSLSQDMAEVVSDGTELEGSK